MYITIMIIGFIILSFLLQLITEKIEENYSFICATAFVILSILIEIIYLVGFSLIYVKFVLLK